MQYAQRKLQRSVTEMRRSRIGLPRVSSGCTTQGYVAERDMWSTCVNVLRMKMIQVRNVPDELHRELKARAARKGLSLSDYVLDLIEDDLARPTLEEALERISKLPRPRAAVRGADLVRAARAEREEELAFRLRK